MRKKSRLLAVLVQDKMLSVVECELDVKHGFIIGVATIGAVEVNAKNMNITRVLSCIN